MMEFLVLGGNKEEGQQNCCLGLVEVSLWPV